MGTCREHTTHTHTQFVVSTHLYGQALTHAHFNPNAEFMRTVYATAVGFVMMGFIGFFVKLVHIPINQIIVS